MFIAALLTMEATYVSIDRWMGKDVVHVYKGILLSNKKE